MDPLTLALIMGGGSMLKNELDRPNLDRKAKLAADTTLYSPWTGMRPDMSYMNAPSTLDAGLQGGVQGYAFGQNMENAAAAKANTAAQTKFYESLVPQKAAETPAAPGAAGPTGPAAVEPQMDMRWDAYRSRNLLYEPRKGRHYDLAGNQWTRMSPDRVRSEYELG